MLILYLVVILFIFLVALDRLLKNEQFEKIPGPSGLFLVNNTLDVIREPVRLIRYLTHLSSKYKDIFRLRVGLKNVVIICNPDDVQALINGSKYNGKGFVYDFSRPWLGDGLLLSDGVKWHQRRKILTPAFHFNILKNFYSILLDNSEILLDRIETEVSQPRTEILDIVSDYTLRSICETAMGTKLDEETTDFGITYKNSLSSLGTLSVLRAQRVWQYSDLIYNLTSRGQEFHSTLKTTHEFRDKVVNRRIDDLCSKNIIRFDDDEDNDRVEIYGKKKLAMLDLLLEAEKRGTIDRSGINEEVDTFMFEGHDTTATALQFTFMILANNQEIQDKIVEECNAILGSSDALPTMNDLTQMKYLDCCIKESLRMYPPVFFISRTSDGPIKLNDYECPKRTDVSIALRELHLRSDQFVEPYKYNPDRFLQEPTWHQFAYIPFSAGPRNCIGQKFAMMEMKLAVCMVLRRYRVLPVTKPEDIIFDFHFTLRSKDPIFVKFEKR
ncbi:cytochrome P450 4C1-like isoform X1 [Leptidea sinapis]|uniref:cytochrome P450 4C1-like isoform X1 n=2 Tax=Leptidea sinapis TaxID=189913 RepID=UPI002128B33B|nr:cytochrome P450 4C1-like isoform X1 [Leptidea sinapis]